MDLDGLFSRGRPRCPWCDLVGHEPEGEVVVRREPEQVPFPSSPPPLYGLMHFELSSIKVGNQIV